MSYDLEIAVKVEGCDYYARIDEPGYANPTYNISKIFRLSMDWDFKLGEYYRCSEVMPKIEQGISRLRDNWEEYKQYEPDNGWGSVGGARECLESLRKCIYENAEYIPIECLYMRW